MENNSKKSKCTKKYGHLARWNNLEVSKFREHKDNKIRMRKQLFEMFCYKIATEGLFQNRNVVCIKKEVEIFVCNDGKKSCLSVWWWQHRNGKWCHKTKTSPL